MSTEVRQIIEIEAPRHDVWTVLADLSSVQDYDHDVVRSFYVSESREGVGARRQCDLPDGSYLREQVVEWREGESYAIEVYEDGTSFPLTNQRAEFNLGETATGTRVRMSYRFEIKPGSPPEVGPEMEGMAGELVGSLLVNLKKFVETGVAVGSVEA